MRLKNFWFSIFCMSLILSCEKDKDPISSSSEVSSDTVTIDFPMEIGSSWRYSIIDTAHNIYTGDNEVFYDTVDVKIIDSTVLPNGNIAKIWQYQFRDRIDSVFVAQSVDTLYFYWDNTYLVIKLIILFPLEVNKEWQLSAFDYKVFLTDTLFSPAGLFTDVFQIKEYPTRLGNGVGTNEYFIVPDIGIVKYKYGIGSTTSNIIHKSKWQLLSYNVIN